MKKLIIIVIGFSFAITHIYGQNIQMYVNGQKRSYGISTTKMFVKSCPNYDFNDDMNTMISKKNHSPS